MTIPLPGPPTGQLPPIAKIRQTSPADLGAALGYLTSLYNPEIHLHPHSYRRTGRGRSSSSSSSQDVTGCRRAASEVSAPPAPELDTIRGDAFERSYAIRWLTALVSCAEQLDTDDANVESIVQNAAGLLAICAGTASAGTRSRVFSFSPCGAADTASDIKVQLTDLPLDNQDYTSVGAQTWGGACLLADMLVQAPSEFGLHPAPAEGSPPLRVLELGAGTGLVGIAAGKTLQAHREAAEVVLTDFHPTVLDNLRSNVAANFAHATSGVLASVHRLDWAHFAAAADAPSSLKLDAPFDRPFDVVLGADIVYEIEHARWIKACVETLLRRPAPESLASLSQQHPEFHLVIPLRATHAAECQTVEQVFPLAGAVRGGAESPPEGVSPTQSLAITGKEVIFCEDVARSSGNEVEYVHYIISWV